MTLFRCSRCREQLELEAFALNQNVCRECQAEKKLLRRYGITVREFNALYDRQGGCCAICGESFEKTPHVDHCHVSLRRRGLLCFLCNTRLGWYEKWKEEVDAYLAAAEEQREG